MSQEWIQLINTIVVPGGLMLVMFSLGLTLAPRDFALVARRPVLVGAGFASHLFVLPLLGLLMGYLFRLPPELALGLFIISLCPAGTTSNAMTFVGRGNVALAVVLTALSSLVTVFTIPIVLSWAVPWFLSGDGRIVPGLDVLNVMRQLAQMTLLPIALGMIVKALAPDAAARMARWLRPTAFVIIVVVIAISVASGFSRFVVHLVDATPAIFALNVAAMAFGLLLGRLIRVGARDAMTLSIETGVQNVVLAIFLTSTVLHNEALALTQNIYGVIMIFNATLLIRWWRGRVIAEEAI